MPRGGQPGPKRMRPKGEGDARSMPGHKGPKTSLPSKGVESPTPSSKHVGYREPRPK